VLYIYGIVPHANFLPAIIQLLHETFEGKPEGQDYTWFVEGREGIFDALDSVSPLGLQ
jgi:hypothetical protein